MRVGNERCFNSTTIAVPVQALNCLLIFCAFRCIIWSLASGYCVAACLLEDPMPFSRTAGSLSRGGDAVKQSPPLRGQAGFAMGVVGLFGPTGIASLLPFVQCAHTACADVDTAQLTVDNETPALDIRPILTLRPLLGVRNIVSSYCTLAANLAFCH